jgi:hypothetical protein
MLHRIDDFLMDKVYQKISNKFQVLTGRTCFSLERYRLTGLAIIYTLLTFTSFGEVKKYTADGFIIFMVVILISLLLFKIYESHKEEKLFDDITKDTLNIKRITLFYSRVVSLINWSLYLIFPILNIIEREIYDFTISLLLPIFWVSSVYFECCTPLPPCKSKAKEWIKGFFSVLKLSAVKSSM